MIEFVLYSVLSMWALWAFYVFTMGVYRLHLSKELKGINAILAWPLVFVAYAIDILVNITPATIMFLDLPRELLVTSRLQRYMRQGSGWRCIVATYICDNMLDIFDPKGNHC